uniref:Uncharacterized protein n=1 Tax=Candidatus Kentrum sp. SD TaxID=2126332 RepID=A0A451BS60_9GAMM|nr:MAG: hypothetical protein BECKSD772F_GA0070984_104616 [Candidatus Kentron sp. SD]VFK47139.1 MAG: hypothetical protein BECKSD772E_GA0070983_108810 [Candidatus Kentron sp. SD]VFK81151.1 MAG: hypothetical protein BECKSD772D_GA0070982_12362 [Candidatus Kentron sp. SD]
MKEIKKESKKKQDTKVIGLRIPTDMLEQIHGDINKRSVRLPRNIWILEAIDKKLNRY